MNDSTAKKITASPVFTLYKRLCMEITNQLIFDLVQRVSCRYNFIQNFVIKFETYIVIKFKD